MNPVLLPCGRSAIVREFDGSAQEILSNEKLIKSGDWFDLLLGRALDQLEDRRGAAISPATILRLPSGSRLRLLIEARRATYGDDVNVTWDCIACGESGSMPLDLTRVDDVPYPEGLPSQTFTTQARGKVITAGWGDGETERAFIKGRAARQWGNMDELLTRVIAVDNNRVSPREVLKLPAPVLDEVRLALRSMTPRLPLDPDEPEVPNAWGLPCAGPRSRIQVACGSCGKRAHRALEGVSDFLFRGLASQLD